MKIWHRTLFAMLLLLGMTCAAPRFLPSDASLRGQFQRHRVEFDSLASLAIADTQLVGMGQFGALVFVKNTPTYNRRLTEDEIRTTGRSVFRRLMERAGLPALSRQPTGDAVRFVIVSGGGSRKGFLYSARPLEPLLASLDAHAYGCVRLGAGWFLFLEPTD